MLSGLNSSICGEDVIPDNTIVSVEKMLDQITQYYCVITQWSNIFSTDTIVLSGLTSSPIVLWRRC